MSSTTDKIEEEIKSLHLHVLIDVIVPLCSNDSTVLVTLPNQSVNQGAVYPRT